MGTFIIHDTKTVTVVKEVPSKPVVVVKEVKVGGALPTDRGTHLDLIGSGSVDTDRTRSFGQMYREDARLSTNLSDYTNLYVRGGIGQVYNGQAFYGTRNGQSFFGSRQYSFTTYSVGLGHKFGDNFRLDASYGQRAINNGLLFNGSPTFHSADLTATFRVF